jgi:hypothetical protein
MDRVQNASGRAVETLESLLSDKKSPSVRLGAARTLLELAIHSNDRTEILQKLDRLEQLQRESESR